jgi:UDP-glucose 4-epimerase
VTRLPQGGPDGLAGQRLLVTGASGFIGTRVCERAADLGAVVRGVSRRPSPDASPAVRWEHVDLTDEFVTRALVRRVEPQVVLHLASEVSGDRSPDVILPMVHANLLAAVNVMLAAQETGCGRVVLAGSMEEPDLGDAEAVAQSPYAAAKWAALAYARMFRALYGLPVVHLRIFMVYGPGQRDLRKLVPYVTTSLLRGDAPELMSGEREVDWVYVDDVVDAFLAAAVTPGAEGASLDIGSGELVRVREVVARLRRLVGGDAEPSFGVLPDRKLERVRVADPAPAAAAIGWRPRTSLDEGLARTVDFYRARIEPTAARPRSSSR